MIREHLGPEFEAFCAAVLAEFPPEQPVAPDDASVRIFHPKNFAEIYESRKDLQAAKLILVRHPYAQQMYEEYLEMLKGTVEDGKNLFEREVEVNTKNDGITTWEPLMFSYEVPEDTTHYMQWHRSEVTREQRARSVAGLLWFFGYEPSDVVVVVNPINRRSVLTYEHDHLLIRWQGGNQHFKPLPNPLKIFGYRPINFADF